MPFTALFKLFLASTSDRPQSPISNAKSPEMTGAAKEVPAHSAYPVGSARTVPLGFTGIVPAKAPRHVPYVISPSLTCQSGPFEYGARTGLPLSSISRAPTPNAADRRAG